MTLSILKIIKAQATLDQQKSFDSHGCSKYTLGGPVSFKETSIVRNNFGTAETLNLLLKTLQDLQYWYKYMMEEVQLYTSYRMLTIQTL